MSERAVINETQRSSGQEGGGQRLTGANVVTKIARVSGVVNDDAVFVGSGGSRCEQLVDGSIDGHGEIGATASPAFDATRQPGHQRTERTGKLGAREFRH